MSSSPGKKILTLAGVFFGVWIAGKYLLPLVMPFLLGYALAKLSEPAVGFVEKRMKLRRGAAVGIGVSLTLVFLLAAIALLIALAVRELGQLAGTLPQLAQSARQMLLSFQDTLVSLAGRLPEGIGGVVTDSLLRLFGSGGALVDSLVGKLPGLATGILSILPDSFLSFGTAILSAYLICARMPQIKRAVTQRLPGIWREKYLPALKSLRRAISGWLRAQCKLAGGTYVIVAAGFLLLGVKNGLLWAIAVALVDAVPLLGTGTVLVPWAALCFLQGNTLRAVGLLALYAVSFLTRSALEPRLVGKQLGLDPLITLVCLYVGYQLWGVLGLVAAPMLAAGATQLTQLKPGDR